MRNILFIAITFYMAGFVFGQSWEDSLRLGKKYYEEKQFDKAYETLLEAQKLAPSSIDLSQDIGNAAYRSNDFEMAEKAFRAAASKDIDENKKAENWHNVGNSQMKAKNYQSAIESFKQSLRMNPNAEKTRYNLAEAQRRLKIQEEQEKQQQDKDQQNQADDENKQDQKSKSDQQEKDKKESEGKENKEQKQDPSQQGGKSNEKANTEPSSKLSERKTERLLEELLKQEMQTKKKVRGVESGTNKEQIKSGKRW